MGYSRDSFYPQKSVRSVIPIADHDLPAAISEFVLYELSDSHQQWLGLGG